LGEGSIFSFTISCAAKPELEKKAGGDDDSPESENCDFSGKRCLVVDDIGINCDIIREFLSSTGIMLETAANGKEAMEKFSAAANGYYDIILMDMQMPVMDGCTATRKIRAIEAERRMINGEQPSGPWREVPIIAMTANVLQEDVQIAMNSGMNAHMGKPIELAVLLGVLTVTLQNPN